MYDSGLSLNINSEPKSQPVTLEMLDQIRKVSSCQNESIGRIESKLHELLNLRQPENGEAVKGSVGAISDFNSAMIQEIRLLEKNYNRLEGILAHLHQIC